jgi:hypothetical protein
MSIYIKLSTLEFPRYEGDIRIDHPEITEDQTGDTFPCPDTYAKVRIGTYPTIDNDTQYVEYDTPAFINGEWVSEYKVINMSQEFIDEVKKQKEKTSPLMKSGKVPNVIV